MTCTIDTSPIMRLAELVSRSKLPGIKANEALRILNALGCDAASVWFALIELALDLGTVNVRHESLESMVGLDPGELESALSWLATARLASTWSSDGTTFATLSPYSAALASITLTSADTDSTLSWRRIGTREARDRPRQSKRVRNATDLQIRIEQLVDDGLDPSEIAAARESLDEPKRSPRVPDSVLTTPPRPRILLTGSTTVWNEGEAPEHCPNHNRTARPRPFHSETSQPRGNEPRPERQAILGPGTLCLRCDSWSLDWLLLRIRRFAEAQTQAKTTNRPTFAKSHNKRAKQ